MESTAEVIRNRARDVFEGARDDKVGIYRGTKNLVATTTENYRGRFLLELIQNGFDAHPEGTSSGRIGVTFMEDEGPHGVLYVANGGRPLSRSNFERMSSLGDSDKKRGEGIGNKGVGFKSVFQVCDRPEVYSARDGSDPGFAGYSFRFGELADLDAFVDGDKTLRNRIEKNLSLSLLTVPLDTVPPTVTRMRREGYVTVLRLPLASKVAAEEVSERIASIASSRSPVMLFLDRLEHLTIRQAANAKPLVLTRHESADSGIKHVVLNGSERYLMFERQVAPDQLAAALKKSVDEKLLDEKWLEWTAPARVSIAVGDGWEIAEPSPFTFLPMADDARSPLGGHINAPFVTDYARLTLDLKNHVNRLLMHEIASLCVESAQTLARERRNANAVVDLLAWDRGHGDWVDKAARAQARLAPHDLMCLPVRGDENWHPSSSLSTWPGDGCSVITVERVVDSAGARMIDTDQVSARRIARLEQSMPAGRSLAPHPELLADWVETVADCLGRDAAAVETWQRFYDDLPLLFSDGAPLAGKSILLTESGHIVAADGSAHPTASQSSRARGRQRAVFFAPKAAGTEDDDAIELEADVRISTPAPLARRIDFLHPDLNWHVGRQQTPGRKFLQDNRLAQQFRTASLLSHLAQMMDARPSKEVKRAALQFAFQLFAANPTRHAKELRLAGLFVPNLEGEWIRADGAHFSRGWKIEGADDLSDLADAARESDSELAALTSRLIAPPERVGGQRVKPARWLQFLRAIGVTVSLPILEATDPRRLLGRSLRGESLAGKGAPSALPPAVVEQWKSGISTAGNWNHPETDFTAKSPLYWLMGQGECDALPVVLRSAYARLALMTVPLLSDEHRRTTWRRQRPGGITTDVETPLWAHLKHSAWVPVQQPGGGPADFLTPAETWNATIEHRMAAAYSPLVEARLRTLLASLPAVDATWTDLGFRQWGDPRFGGELIDHLTELFVSRDIPNTALDHFRASLAEAWGAVGGGRSRTEPRGQDGVLIVRAGQVDFVARDEAASSQVFVTATDDRSATARLVRELGWAELMYEASPDAGAGVAEQLASIWPGEVNLTAAWELEVLVDGKRLGQSERRARLTDEVPWLPMLVVASLRFPRASGLRIGRHVADVLDTMERIQLVRARRVQVLSAGGRADLPDRLRGVLPLPGDPPILVAESHDSEITWHGLDMLLQGVLELVGQERFKAEVSLTLRQLAPDGDMDIERPSTPELAAALGVADEQLHQVESAVSGAVEGVIERLKMVAPVLWGPGALTQLTEFASAPRTHDELVTLVAGFCNDSTVGARIVKHATAAATANELRRRLEISLPDFNDAVRTYFPTMPPVDNTDVLADQFRYRLGQRRSELIEWIRKCRYPEFSAGHAQVDWRQITSLTFIEPDPNWGTTLDELSRTQIDRQINEVMRNRFGSPDASGAELPALTDIRNANGAPLRTRIEGARHSVTAWCARNRTRRPSAWEGADFAADIRERLDGVGALDFEELSDEQLTSWLVKIDVWPPGMPETLVRDLLGLSDQELQAESEAENERRVQAARAASQVRFQGEAVDVDESLGGLVSRVAAFLETDPASLRARYKSTKLANLSGTPTTGARPSKSPARFGTASSRLTSAQTGAIGMVGEFVAFHWLKRHDRSGVVDETCWKSTNVRRVFEGAKGDDGLGFDFEVPHRDGSIMYEVKATSGEAGMIELGETEVRCAQQYSRSDRWRLLIVEEALSDEPRVHVLPNPFHRSSRDLYKFSGNSVRLHFALRTRD